MRGCVRVNMCVAWCCCGLGERLGSWYDCLSHLILIDLAGALGAVGFAELRHTVQIDDICTVAHSWRERCRVCCCRWRGFTLAGFSEDVLQCATA